MSLTRTTTIEVRSDHTATLELPPEIPAGPMTITYTVQEQNLGEAPPRTPADILRELESEGLIGDWAERDDLPRTPEEFAAWRKKIWAGEPL